MSRPAVDYEVVNEDALPLPDDATGPVLFDLREEHRDQSRNSPTPAPALGGELIPLRIEEPSATPAPYLPSEDPIEAPRPARQRRRVVATLTGKPLWYGVYSFPFRLANLRAFIMLLFTMTFMALLASGLHYLYDLMFSIPESQELSGFSMLVHRGAMQVFVCLVVFTMFATVQQAPVFLNVIEETAAGIDEIDWPRDPWFEYLGRWLYLAWVAGAAAAPGAMVWASLALPPAAFIWLILGFGGLLFPIFLLSTLSAGHVWVLLEPRLLFRFALKPHTLAFLYGNAVLFGLPSVLLGYAVIVQFWLYLLPVAGVAWSAALLGYARVLGRVGYELGEEGR